MEALYSKLYARYSKLKTKKWAEVEEFDREQEAKFLNHLNAADELIEHLRNENNRLCGQVNDFRSEVALIRFSQHEQYAEYQKLVMEEKKKNKDLSDEVERLKASTNAQVGSDTYDGILVKTTRKRIRHSETEREVLVSPSVSDGLEHASVIGSANHSSKETIAGAALLDDHQAKCSGRKTDRAGGDTDVTGPPYNCVFKDLVECLLGMQLSSVSQADGASISAIHQPSGYTFSLTQINNSCEKEPVILYRVLSLGTFERVAPEWMKEVLMFSKKMCPIFFERVSRAIKLYR